MLRVQRIGYVYAILSFEIFLRISVVRCFNITQIPSGFSIGAATSAYQIEGAWNIDGKGKSNWDARTHDEVSCPPAHRDNGDVACDSYRKYREDIRLLKDIGFTHYRFSLSWSRILPNGFANEINQQGLNYYKDLIYELLNCGIAPYVTLYNWDHPQVLDQYGGWTNELMVDWFVDYARIVFRELGPYVKFFTTINDPAGLCRILYKSKNQSFGPHDNPAIYLCGHNTLKAHARAYHVYNTEFRTRQKGKIGIALTCNNYNSVISGDCCSDDIAFDFNCGWFANPIFSRDGDYPKVMKDRIYKNSIAEGLHRSKLPTFTDYWIQCIRQSSDYFGLNHYSSIFVMPVDSNQGVPYYGGSGLIEVTNHEQRGTKNNQSHIASDGFRRILHKIKDKYNNPPIYVLENGYSDDGKYTDDRERVDYLYCYMQQMFTAMNAGCNIKGYTIWSLLDNFDWIYGYKKKFGLVGVNFSDPNRTRTRKYSSYWLRQVLCSRTIVPVL